MTTIELYRDRNQKFRWRVTAGNGEVVGASTQGYTRKVNLMKNLSMLCSALCNVMTLPTQPQSGYRIIDRTCKVEVTHG